MIDLDNEVAQKIAAGLKSKFPALKGKRIDQDAIAGVVAAVVREVSGSEFAKARASAAMAYSIEEISARLLPISRSKIYGEINEGRLEAVKIGGRTVVPDWSLKAYIKCLPRIRPRLDGSRSDGSITESDVDEIE